MKSAQSRIELLSQRALLFQGKRVAMYDQNPSKTNQQNPDDRKDKLTIKGLPLSVSNDEVKNFLESKNIVLSSPVKYSFMRDDSGALTSYRNGDRFVYCTPFDPPLDKQQNIASFYCQIIHHGKENYSCKACNTSGHRVGDAQCVAKADDGSILAFHGYQHPLSTLFWSPLTAFGEEESFKSAEHAFR